MKIAIIGTRGVPARYGGFETAAEEISERLVQKGHKVTVYCRYGNERGNPSIYRGVKLIYIPHVDSKNLGTLSHSFLSFIHSVFQQYDVILAFNVGIAPLCIIPKLFGKKIVLNVDGLEWKRRKWGWLAKKYFQLSAYFSRLFVDRIVSDSRVIQKYYADKYGIISTYIAYGAYIEKSLQPERLKKYKVEKDNYFFVLSRLEPENNADLIIAAFEKVKTTKKLLIVGGASYKSNYILELKRTRDSRIIFLNPIYDKGDLRELYCNCYAYIHGNEVGGTNPALLSAMGYGACILCINVPFNKEVVGNTAILYEKLINDLKEKIEFILKHPESMEKYRKKVQTRVMQNYKWIEVINAYESLFSNITK